jgi:uncharacterized protein (TIGR04255 family)
VASLPEFVNPPVTEVAVGVQFAPIPQLRPIELADLREKWRGEYPVSQDQPPLPPSIEGQPGGMPRVQLRLGPPVMSRLWFLSNDSTRLVQLQLDRLIVNWRQVKGDEMYPRFPEMQKRFEQRASELSAFVFERGFGAIDVNQVELNYVNFIPDADDRPRPLEDVLRVTTLNSANHLDPPQQARLGLTFEIPDVGKPPVRLYTEAAPSRVGERSGVQFRLTVRGAPTGGSIANALEFIDGAHRHIVQSFHEMTVPEMHNVWVRKEEP